MVGTSPIGVLRRATQTGMAATAAGPWAIEGGGSVGDHRPRAPNDMAHQVAAAARAAVVTGGRPLADLVVSHPVGTATLVATRLLGWPVRRALATAVVIDQGLPALTAHSTMAPARFLRLWTHANRFRRRWPASLQRSRTELEREVAVDRTGSRLGSVAPDRPITGTVRQPPLALLPHRIDGTTVAWAIDLDHTDDPDRLEADLAGLSHTDPRVLRADIGHRPVHPTSPGPGPDRHQWEVVVDFDIEPPPWALSVLGGTALFHTNDRRLVAHHPHEEGGSHGNG